MLLDAKVPQASALPGDGTCRPGDEMGITWNTVARTAGGQAVLAATLDNGQGLRARVMNHGATLLELWVPDRQGRQADVVLGFDDARAYLGVHPYLGAVVGRYANRIADARFELGGRRHVLSANEGAHHLHGGLRGFDKLEWMPGRESSSAFPEIVWTCTSPNGDEGYPGRLEASVAYALTPDNALRIDYEAWTDAPTILNLTHHAYWNLGVHDDVLEHEIEIFGSRFLPVDAALIPTGELRPVEGTPMDFRRPAAVGARLGEADEQLLRGGGGYDHNWVLDRAAPGLLPAARLHEPRLGRTMEVLTTQPGLQFYSGNQLDGSLVGKRGRTYGRHAGLCLETQHFPDSPHHPEFPSTVLMPGDVYRHTTLYRFTADDERSAAA